MSDESSPLLQFPGMNGRNFDGLGDQHPKFCHIVGIRSLTQPPDQKSNDHTTSLYYRAARHRRNQGATHTFTATLTNPLLLSQVVLGAALTALGASDTSRVLITVFGAMNTIIAGLIAFLKSRGQPVRAHMFRDELERVEDEIEDPAVMWHGVSRGVHGYDAIDTTDSVTVRSEVARLTRLYDCAVKNSTMNDPDNYAAGMPGDPYSAALKTWPGQLGQPVRSLPVPQAPASGVSAPAGVDTAAPAQTPAPAALESVVDPDDSIATKAPEPPKFKEPEKPAGSDKAKEIEKQSAAVADEKPAESDKDASVTSQPATSTGPPAESSAFARADRANESSDASGSSTTPVNGDSLSTAGKSQKHSEDTSQPEGKKD